MKLFSKIDKGYLSAINWATSTKGAMYILTVLIWASVFLNPPDTIYAWLVLIVSVYYQGVALPGLGYQQKAEGEETRNLMISINQEEVQELENLKEMLAEIKDMHGELHQILSELKEQ